MSQVELPEITDKMKVKFRAWHCHLKSDDNNNNNNNGNNNNNSKEINNTTNDFLPGNRDVNPPTTIITNPSVAAVKAGMITRRMQVRIQDEAERLGSVQTWSKTRKRKSG